MPISPYCVSPLDTCAFERNAVLFEKIGRYSQPLGANNFALWQVTNVRTLFILGYTASIRSDAECYDECDDGN